MGIVYVTETQERLCFNHAVKRAIKGIRIQAEIDDCHPINCTACYNDYKDGVLHEGESIHIIIDDVQIRKTDL